MTCEKFLENFEGINLPILGVRLPEIQITDAHKKKYKLGKDSSNYEFLRSLCVEGFNKLNLDKKSPEYKKYGDRVKYELDMFKDLGFVDYILLVWDVINFCKEGDIPVGPGRGSAAGSLVLYLIDVTKIDSIKYNLYFERFVSKIRAKKTVVDGITYLDGGLLCDIDVDISYYRRHEVIEYLEQKYEGKVCKILTLNTLSGKLLIKECGKIISGKSEEEMTHVSSLIPKNFGVVQDLDKAYEEVEDFKEWCDKNKRIYETALKLKDIIKNKSLHASGIMISYGKLDESCPTELSSDKEIVSSYSMDQVSLFAVKLDALGLRAVSVVDDVCKSLGIKMSDIDINHSSIYQALQDLKQPHGLFQIEADLAFKTIQKVKPKHIEELSAVMALARPGAYQFIDKFANYVNNGVTESIHPFFDPILKRTGSLCLYQEQLMQMLNLIGFSLDEAETCRKIVGKKLLDKVKEWEKKIKDKIAEKKLDPSIGDIVWKILEDSASYSFNFSHSLAYSVLCAMTVYLKFNHPREFYLSLLKMTQNEPDPTGEISKIHREMSHFNLELLPPSLTKSKIDFSIEGNNLRFGLSAIKGVAGKTIEKFNNFKREFSNKFELFESANQAGLNIGVLSGLIQAGCLQSLGNNRVLMTYEAQLWNILSDKEKRLCLNHGQNFEYKLPTLIKAMVETLKDEKGKPLIKQSRFETIKKHSEKYKKIYELNKASQDYANFYFETSLLGYAFTKKLIDIYIDKKEELIPIREVLDSVEGEHVSFVGIVSEKPAKGVSREKKSPYLKLMVADEEASIKTMIFNKSLESCEQLNNGLPIEGDIVIISGTKKGDDCVFANQIAVQLNKIFTKISSLKDKNDKEEKPLI